LIPGGPGAARLRAIVHPRPLPSRAPYRLSCRLGALLAKHRALVTCPYALDDTTPPHPVFSSALAWFEAEHLGPILALQNQVHLLHHALTD